jgi:hypothetical protein
MSEEVEDKSALDKDVKKVITELASKALTPAAEEIGKGLVTVAKTVNLALKPLNGIIWGYEQIEKHINSAVSSKLSNIHPDRIISPSPHVAGPIVESLRYTGEIEELRAMFTSLLATSMDKEQKHKAHPAFVEVIKQLSVDEAKVLAELSSLADYPLICEAVYSINDIHTSYEEMYPEFSKLVEDIDIESNVNIPTYIGNLVRLGIFEIRRTTDSRLEESSPYESPSFYGTSIPVVLKESGYEALYVTDFGKQFISVCINAEFDS